MGLEGRALQSKLHFKRSLTARVDKKKKLRKQKSKIGILKAQRAGANTSTSLEWNTDLF